MSRVDPQGTRLPIKIDSTSNGEYPPIPVGERNLEANRVALERATENARRLSITRRRFLVSSAGAATTLLAFNEVNAAAGKLGAFYDIPRDAALDNDLARTVMEGSEFIFDVHGHFANPTGAWLKKVPPGQSPVLNPTPEISAERFIKDVFLDSDTDMMVLTFIPSMSDAEPLTIEEAAATQKIIDNLEGTKRLLIHGRVNPNQEGDIDRMEQLAKQYGVVGWKTYTQWGPADNAYYSLQTGLGFELTDDRYGVPFIERARAIGIRNICIHKGIPFGRDASYKYARCDDIGKAARKFPDMNFLVYHAGFDPENPELPFEPGAGPQRHRLAGAVAAGQRHRAQQQRLRRRRAPPGTCSAATRTPRRTGWASCSSTSARTTCSGAPTRSGPARPRTRSRPGAPSRSPSRCATVTAIPRSRLSSGPRSSASTPPGPTGSAPRR